MYAVVSDNNNCVGRIFQFFLNDSERIENVRMNKKKKFVNCELHV